ncbi:MAG: aminopeptidase P family N-terminal domain-containing protein [Firmicutes bacterium]|nr:aminopeptidase P family N-terminal domain-containing protein [Bacillota bacterium]
MLLEISDRELKRRREALVKELSEQGVKAYILFSATDIFYLTRFAFIPTERPVALVLTAENRAVLLVPRLEEEHAQEGARVEGVRSYPEYPTEKHPMEYLKELLIDLALATGPLAADADGYGSPSGYRGPRLSQVLPEVGVSVLRGLVEKLRVIKSPEEVALI